MRSIHRYQLTAARTQILRVRPSCSSRPVASVGILGSRSPVLWLEGDDALPEQEKTIELRGTGESIDDVPSYALFVGSISWLLRRPDEYLMMGVHVWMHWAEKK